MKHLPTCFLLLLSVASTASLAQVVYNNASTAGESYARGISGIIQSQGQKNVDDSQARINNQDAYSAAIDNSVKSVNAYWEKKDIYAQRVQQQNYAIQQRRDMLLEKNRLQPLTAAEFDRTTGQITWPKILDQPQYDKYRNTFDELFAKRAKEGALTSDDYMVGMTTSKEFRSFLTSQRDTYPTPVLSQMVRFVLKLNRDLDDNLS
jgi:hypothetical protein